MLSKKLLTMGTLSTLLIGTTLFAQEKDCTNGACFVSLDKAVSVKTSTQEEKKLMPLVQKSELDNSITIVLDGDEVTVFPSYVMTEEEKVNYYDEEIVNEELFLLVQPIEKIEDVMLEKINLPSTEYFCDNDKLPMYENNSNIYVCV